MRQPITDDDWETVIAIAHTKLTASDFVEDESTKIDRSLKGTEPDFVGSDGHARSVVVTITILQHPPEKDGN